MKQMDYIVYYYKERKQTDMRGLRVSDKGNRENMCTAMHTP